MFTCFEICTKACGYSLCLHTHIRGFCSWDDGKLLPEIDSIVLGSFYPPAQMDLHFSELVTLYACCISIPPLFMNSPLEKVSWMCRDSLGEAVLVSGVSS